MQKTAKQMKRSLNRYNILLFLSVFFYSSVVWGQQAQEPDTPFPTNLFEPAPGPHNFLAVESPEIGEDMKPSIGVLFSYQHKPFVILACDSDGNCGDDVNISQVQGTIDSVKSALVSDILASFNFLKRFQVGLAIPLYVWQAGQTSRVVFNSITGEEWLIGDEDYNSFGVIGDIRIHLKGRILGKENENGFALSAAIIPTLPMSKWTGQGEGYTGSSFLTVTAPQVIAGYRYGPLRAAANLGFLWREKEQMYSAQIGHSIKYGGAVGYNFELKPKIFNIEVFAEIYGLKSLVSSNFSDMESAPLMFTGGGNFKVKDFKITAAAGGGIISGIGVPQVQAMLGVNWTPTTKKDESAYMVTEWDVDGDGIDNDVDECPNRPEDLDSYQDEDGCPDEDNDNDGIQDGYDSCPNEPEDKDNFRDDDGCPDLDHDEDGIKEPSDKCPEIAEDYDEFEDSDGCPEKDNDADGFEDESDLCPNLAEDKDGFEDTDGCPDFDNDNDGVPDTQDKCPDELESLNLLADEDGCPEKAKAFVVIADDRFVQKQKVEFKGKTTTMTGDSSFKVLDIIANVLVGNSALRLSVESHTDAKGSTDSNRDLTKQRSEEIKAYLAKKGVAPERIETVGWGSEQPLQSNRTKAGRSENNRVEFIIIRPVRKAPQEEEASTEEEEETMDFTEEEDSEEMDFTIEEEEEVDEEMDFTEDEVE